MADPPPSSRTRCRSTSSARACGASALMALVAPTRCTSQWSMRRRGGVLPVISLHFKIAGRSTLEGTPPHCTPPAKPCSSHPDRCCGGPAPHHANASCSVPRKPCPSHPGVTWCPSDPNQHQCSGGAPPPSHSDAPGGWVEFTACPVADMKGAPSFHPQRPQQQLTCGCVGNYYQDVMFRVAKFNSTGGPVDIRYFVRERRLSSGLRALCSLTISRCLCSGHLRLPHRRDACARHGIQ